MYLLVTPDDARYWRMDYRFAGKRRTLAIGVYPTVSLATRAHIAKKHEHCWQTTLILRREEGFETRAKLAHENTFEAVAREWLGKQQSRLSPRYCALLLARLEADIFPHIGSRPIAEIDAPELLDAIRKVEKRGAIETARRFGKSAGKYFATPLQLGVQNMIRRPTLRGAIESPGRPRGHKAMAISELPRFLSALEAYDGDLRTRLALKLVVLTFARTTELRAARWSEFEKLDGKKPYGEFRPAHENEARAYCAARAARL